MSVDAEDRVGLGPKAAARKRGSLFHSGVPCVAGYPRIGLLAFAALTLAACSGQSFDLASPKAASELPAVGYGASLDPAPPNPSELPPPAQGYTRLPDFDLDVRLPPGARLETRGYIDAGEGCRLRVEIDPAPHSLELVIRNSQYGAPVFLRREEFAGGWRVRYGSADSQGSHVLQRLQAGGMRVDCSGDAHDIAGAECIEKICESIRAVPGGVAQTASPAAMPAVRTSAGGGITGGSAGGVSVWADGRVRFHGPQCRRGRFGTIPRERVDRLMAAFRSAKFGSFEPMHARGGGDCYFYSISAVIDGHEHSSGYEDCGNEGPSKLRKLFTFVERTTGANVCQ